MKKTLIILALPLMFLAANAQNERRIYTSSELKAMQDRAGKQSLSKEQKKQIEAIQDSIDNAMAVQALETLDFVMEADQLVFKRGETAFVTSSTNFIQLSDDKATVQVAPFNGGGPNGIGGITLDGRASNIRIKNDNKSNTLFSMNVLGSGISASIDIILYAGSNRASVTINPNFSSNRVTLNGRLLPTGQSNTFKGRAF